MNEREWERVRAFVCERENMSVCMTGWEALITERVIASDSE